MQRAKSQLRSPTHTKISELNFKIKIEDLKEVVYYIYITSNLTGDFPLARSRGIRIRHEPVISHIGDFLSDDSDYLDSGKLFDLDTFPSFIAN